jgi:hypothetical protein
LIRIPAIYFYYQTDIRGDNLIEAAFNVYDRIAYCTDYPKPQASDCNNDNDDNRCTNTVANKRGRGCPVEQIPTNQLVETKYSKQPYNFNKVVRGEGCTLREKLESINDTGLDINEFIELICLFGMMKYILGRLMFGKFSLKWLLNRNAKEFFDKLKQSRLCEFQQVFEFPELKGYEKYFKW